MQICDMLEIGDTVSIYFPIIGRHEGVVTGYNRITARSRKHGGVSAVSILDFSNGNPKQMTNQGYIGKLSRHETARRAVSREGERGYNIVDKQCINFTNEVNGIPKYSRMQGIALTALAFGFCAYVGYKHKIKIA